MNPHDRAGGPLSAFPTLPATLGLDVHRWRSSGRVRGARGLAGRLGAHGTLWLDHGHVRGYRLDQYDPNRDRAVYVGTAFLTWLVMFERGSNVRNGTHYRIAASILDEMLLQTVRCGECSGIGRECPRCCGTGTEPATAAWRSDRCGSNPADFPERIASVYQTAFGRLVEIERHALDGRGKTG